MAVVKLEEGTLSIDAAVIGRGLNVEPSLVQVRMREGKITVLSERGVDEDAGRYRGNLSLLRARGAEPPAPIHPR
jgi:hypothetical protein